MQQTFLDWAAPYTAPFQPRSYTSFQAAKAIEPTAGTLRAKVLDFIRECGAMGASDDEIQLTLAMEGSTQRPRRIELLTARLICDSGLERPTRSGRLATVWVSV